MLGAPFGIAARHAAYACAPLMGFALFALARTTLRRSGADYALRTVAAGRMGGRSMTAGFVPVSRLGPVLTWRPVTRPSVPAIGDLALTLGDLELF